MCVRPMEGGVATTYTLIYRFLKQQSQHKAAKAVKKAAKSIVVLRDDIEQEGPPLEDIIKEWRMRKNTKSGNADPSSEDSDSSDDSSSDSSSEDTSGSDSDDGSAGSDTPTGAKKLPRKAAERDTSVTLSSAEENARKVAKQVVQIPKKKSTKNTDQGTKGKNKDSDSDSSDSDRSSKNSAPGSSGLKPSSSSSGSSGSSDSSHEEDEKTSESKSLSISESSSGSKDDSDSQQKEDTHVTKRRKTSENGAAVTTMLQQTARVPQKKEIPPPKIKERFQRIKVQNLAPGLQLDNDYGARGGATNDYGERAHRDLITTRGAGFRKEKNKKKRGSYRGGEITMENHSIKFDF